MTHLRRQTPDSEALASSDDEHPINRSISSLRSQVQRRGSWLSEVHASQQRKPSFTSASISSNPSQPSTPAADKAPWPVAPAFGNQAGASQPVHLIGGSIWSTNKAPGIAAGGTFTTDGVVIAPEAIVPRPSMVVDLQNAERRRLEREQQTKAKLQAANAAQAATGAPQQASLPFAIPLKPTLKASRSLSYSAGQQEDQKLPASSLRTSSRDARGILLGQLTEEGDDASVAAYSDHDAPSTDDSNTVTDGHAGLHSSTSPSSAAFNFQQIRHSLLHSQLNTSSPSNQDLYTNIGTRSHWQTQSPFGPLTFPPESRRHSMAEIPTRRGSLSPDSIPVDLKEIYETDPERAKGIIKLRSEAPPNAIWQSLYSYFVPVPEQNNVRTDLPAQDDRLHASLEAKGNPYKTNYIVAFKCARVGVYFLLPGCGLQCNPGDMVIVEADRGQDLGTIIHAGVTLGEARELSLKFSEEQYKWLMMFSRHNQAGNVNPNGNSAAVPGQRTRMPHDDIKPKAIKRIATQHEIMQLQRKEGVEAKAKRTCQQLVDSAGLDMEILDAEWQWDWQKLVFYYFADKYVDFKALVGELFKIYKVRIWMSAVNPASFSRNVTNEPPSGIGPGAILTREGMQSFDNTYHMQYGADPDPYGAVPPYPVPENKANPHTLYGGRGGAQYQTHGSTTHPAPAATATAGPIYGLVSYDARMATTNLPHAMITQVGNPNVSANILRPYWPSVTPNTPTVAKPKRLHPLEDVQGERLNETTVGNPMIYTSYANSAPVSYRSTKDKGHFIQPAIDAQCPPLYGRPQFYEPQPEVGVDEPWVTFAPGRPIHPVQPPIGTRPASDKHAHVENEHEGGVSLIGNNTGMEEQLRRLNFGTLPAQMLNYQPPSPLLPPMPIVRKVTR